MSCSQAYDVLILRSTPVCDISGRYAPPPSLQWGYGRRVTNGTLPPMGQRYFYYLDGFVPIQYFGQRIVIF